MNKMVMALTVISLLSCARPSSSPPEKAEKNIAQQPAEKKTLPAGVYASENRKFLLIAFLESPNPKEFEPGKNNTVRYVLLTENFTPIESPDYRLELSYAMPGMPGMDIIPATVTELRAGEFRATYFFQHGGLDEDCRWEFTYKLFKGNELVDTLIRSLWVKE